MFSFPLHAVYNGTSKIFKKSVSELSTEISSHAIKSIVHENRFFKYERMPENVARNLSETYPVWNLAIKKELDESSEKPDKTNKYFKLLHIQNSFIIFLLPSVNIPTTNRSHTEINRFRVSEFFLTF